jgi:hypothetical protein
MSAAFTRQIFAWLAQVNVDDEMPASAAKLAIAFTRFFNEAQDGAAWASLRTLGTAAAISKTNVEKLLRQFEARDHLRIEWGKPGRGSSNRCWMVMKECPPQSGHSPANCPPQSGHSRRRKSPLLSDESTPEWTDSSKEDSSKEGYLTSFGIQRSNQISGRMDSRGRRIRQCVEAWRLEPRRSARHLGVLSRPPS